MIKWQKLAEKCSQLLAKYQLVLYLLIFFVIFYSLLWVQATPNFMDPDSFYHLKMTKLIAERGPILDFPWLQFTVLKDYYIDHHFLYHLVGVPFVQLLGDLAGFKFYTVALATLFIFGSYLWFKKEKLRFAGIFTLILLYSPALLFRLSLDKATAFSLIFLWLGIYCLFKNKPLWLGVLSFFYVWAYGGFVLIFGLSLIYIFSQAIYSAFLQHSLLAKVKIKLGFNSSILQIKKFGRQLFTLDNWRLAGSCLLGLCLGIIINPYFPKNLLFYWQQLVQIGIINYRGTVNVGGEWYPYGLNNLLADSGLITVFGVLALVLFLVLLKKQKTESIFFFITTLLFLGLTLKSKRYVEYFIPVFVFFAAYCYTFIFANIKIRQYFDQLKKEIYLLGLFLKIMIAALSIVYICIIVKDYWQIQQKFLGGIKFSTFSGIASYLEQNSQPGEVVMQTDWDDFPALFYYNSKNYYIVGLDPTFMYNYDQNLYKLFADITTARKTDNLAKEVKETFKARFFVVDADRAQLERNLQNDGNFTKVYEDVDGKIYRLKD